MRLTHGQDVLRIEIDDDGRGGPAEPSGHGLVGMRERAAIYGGTLEAATLPGRGFRVVAEIPVAVPA